MVYFPGIQDLITMWHSLTMGMKEPRITIFTPEIKACIKYAKIIVMSFLILSINYYAQKRTHTLVLHPYISSIFSFFSPLLFLSIYKKTTILSVWATPDLTTSNLHQNNPNSISRTAG